MNTTYKFFLVILLVLPFACKPQKKQVEKKTKKHIAYIAGWKKLITEKNFNPEGITHINYSFANIVDGKLKLEKENDSVNISRLIKLRAQNKSSFKILLSVGGWEWSENFSDMALTKDSRKVFIESSVNFLNKYDIDGIDLDWEYPGMKGQDNIFRKEDKENITFLLKELRESLDKLSTQKKKTYLLTIATGAYPECFENIEINNIYKYLDYMDLMTYDFTGGWDTLTGHHSPLYTYSKSSKPFSVNTSVDYLLKHGFPSEKIIIGAAFYGRAWSEVNEENNGLFTKAKPANINTDYYFIKDSLLETGRFNRFWDDSAKAPYLYSIKEQIFISYDDKQSIKEKCKYVNNNNLGGIMFWEYFSDSNEELKNTINSFL